MRLGTFAVLEGLNPERNGLDAETALLNMHLDLFDCVHILSSEGAGTGATTKRVKTPRRQARDVSMMKLAMSSMLNEPDTGQPG